MSYVDRLEKNQQHIMSDITYWQQSLFTIFKWLFILSLAFFYYNNLFSTQGTQCNGLHMLPSNPGMPLY